MSVPSVRIRADRFENQQTPMGALPSAVPPQSGRSAARCRMTASRRPVDDCSANIAGFRARLIMSNAGRRLAHQTFARGFGIKPGLFGKASKPSIK